MDSISQNLSVMDGVAIAFAWVAGADNSSSQLEIWFELDGADSASSIVTIT